MIFTGKKKDGHKVTRKNWHHNINVYPETRDIGAKSSGGVEEMNKANYISNMHYCSTYINFINTVPVSS